MGRVKAEMMEYDELGFRKPPDKNICSNHFTDNDIVSYIELKGSKKSCSYCKPRYQSSSVISLDKLMCFLASGIYYFYDDAGNAGMSYDSAEGGYVGTWFDSADLIYNEIALDADNDEIIRDIINNLDDNAWCKRDPFTLNENEELIYEWRNFADVLKHKIRYSFFLTKDAHSYNQKDLSYTLREIASSINELDLIKKLPANQKLYRSIQHRADEKPSSIRRLASPPLEFCKLSNRMSPAGIPMFYGAFDRTTAELETMDLKAIKEKPLLTTAEFILKHDLQIIDLCDLPAIPGIFNEQKRKYRYKTLFLTEFVCELSLPVARDGFEHVDYVPTQVLTEYFRYIVPQIAKYDVDGILYPSAKKGGKKNCVLFFDNDECKDVFLLNQSEINCKKL
jgi:HEPN/RES N-terminal domain 1/RES domain